MFREFGLISSLPNGIQTKDENIKQLFSIENID